MNETKKLTCSICGKEYHDVESRARCEIACVKRHAEEAKKAAEIKQKEEQMARKAEVDNAYANFIKLRTAYLKDYGIYAYHDNAAPSPEEYAAWVEEVMRQIFGH